MIFLTFFNLERQTLDREWWSVAGLTEVSSILLQSNQFQSRYVDAKAFLIHLNFTILIASSLIERTFSSVCFRKAKLCSQISFVYFIVL